MVTERLTVAQGLVKFLGAQFTERDGKRQRFIPGVWAIFGHGNVSGLGQALEEYGDDLALPTYRPQNEQAMVHAAAAFAKHTNRLQTHACTASVGPGSLNMLTAAATATVNRVPVLLLPSDYFANRLPDPVLQQLEHPVEHDSSVNDAFRVVSRFFTRISRPEQLLSAMLEAMRVLADPAETGAVTVCLPEDVQTEAYDFPLEFFRERTWRVRRPVPEREALEDAVRLIRKAKRPFIVTGGGTLYSDASSQLDTFASRFGIPVAETQGGKGALRWDHPLNVGAIGSNGGTAANRLALEADVVIAVGTRLADFTTASKTAFQNENVQFVGLNITAFDSSKLGGLALVADARRGLEALSAELEGFKGTPAAYRKDIAKLKSEWDDIASRYRTPRAEKPQMAQAEVIGLVNEALGSDATVICAAGSLPGDLLKLWRPTDPKSYHLEYGFSCMGYEIPAALGVKMADPKREVVVFIGDGTYLLMNSEIVTAVAEHLEFTVILVDNNAFGSIRGLQMSVGSPSFNNELRARNPDTGRTDGPRVQVDFAAHASSMGATAWHPKTYAELEAALVASRKTRGVKVIVVPVSLEDRVPGFESWWDVPVAQVSKQPKVRQARKAYETAQKKQRRVY
jgi:3D-(3,5/4)-trihydroxycyclohexane-1,2-dione acylhydrolase (decyclizing)